jgi:hypothetical protein
MSEFGSLKCKQQAQCLTIHAYNKHMHSIQVEWQTVELCPRRMWNV